MEVTEIYAAVSFSMSRVEWGGSMNSGELQRSTMEGGIRLKDWVMFEIARWDPGRSRGVEVVVPPAPMGHGGRGRERVEDIVGL